METPDAISKRASVREYENKPVPRELLEKLADAGRRAPTARAVEPWEFIAITDRKRLDAFAEVIDNGKFLAQAPACLVVYCKETKYYLEDGCAATENILLAAVDLGLGACWIAGDKKEYCPKISEFLGVPAGFKLVSLIAVGWPSKKTRQIKKRGLKEVLHWEKF